MGLTWLTKIRFPVDLSQRLPPKPMPTLALFNRLSVMVPYSSLLTATSQLPILLVVTPAAPASHTDIDWLVAKAKSVLDPGVQIMRINETTHPEVVRSFGFTALPGFVLLRRGLELWRHTGAITDPELFHQINFHMDQAQTKSITGQSL